MKLLFTSDLHGHSHRYSALSELVRIHRPDILILGGDLFPLRGITQSSVDAQKLFIRNEFRQSMNAIREFGVLDILIIPGNNDWSPSFSELDGIAQFLPNVPWQSSQLTILGYGFVPPTPFRIKEYEKRDLAADPAPDSESECCFTKDGRMLYENTKTFFESRNSIEEDLESLAWGEGTRIFVAHSPPCGTFLDRLSDGASAGSRAVRKFILKHQPVLSLHGHIHESPKQSGKFLDRLKNTCCINPGQAEQSLSAVIVDLKSGQIEHSVYGREMISC